MIDERHPFMESISAVLRGECSQYGFFTIKMEESNYHEKTDGTFNTYNYAAMYSVR